jgi:DNA-binding MarR family transcriptional regulator
MCDPDETSLQSILDASALRGPENSVGFWVWRMSLAYQHRVEATLKDLDLTHLQFLILVLSGWLGLTAAPVHQSDLAEISGVKAAQVSLMIKALKAKNLIAQTVSKADPRARVITLTGPGVKLLGRAAPLMTDLQSQIWPAGQDTTQMVNLLKSTLKRLQETE